MGKAADAAEQIGLREDLAQEAVDEVLAGRRPTTEALLALEACIRFMRPPLLVQDDQIILDPRSRPPFGEDRREGMGRLAAGVAAITPAGVRAVIGTGFLVGPSTLATAAHVVSELLDGQAELIEGIAVARFGMEHDRTDRPAPIPIVSCVCHPTEDVALLELGEAPAGRGPLPMASAPQLTAGSAILAIGYPSWQPGPAYLEGLFDGIFERKRASPGEVIGAEERAVFHDASTLGGSSGSPVIDVASGRVIGVHTNGAFAYRNTGVVTSVMSQQDGMSGRVTSWG